MSGMQFPVDVRCIKEEDDAAEEKDKWDSNNVKRFKVEHMEESNNQLLQTEIEIGPIKIEENAYNNINMEGTDLLPVDRTPEKVTEALKKTRVREGDTKRWNDNEIKRMLAYIQSHTNFEKPTARLYYLKLLEETKINTKWHLAKRKMRHLEAIILKANELLESTSDGDVLTVQEKIKKICPHYNMLSDIFNDSRIEDEQIFDSDTSLAPFQLASELNASIVTDDSTFKSEPLKLNKRRVHSSAEKPHNLEEKILALRREQLHHEREKQEQNVRLEEKRLSLEEENLKLEKKRIELEQEQIQNDFILKKLRLEKEERIQKLEIELKYKYKNSQM